MLTNEASSPEATAAPERSERVQAPGRRAFAAPAPAATPFSAGWVRGGACPPRAAEPLESSVHPRILKGPCRTCGYTRFRDAMNNLGHDIGRTTSPGPRSAPSWRTVATRRDPSIRSRAARPRTPGCGAPESSSHSTVKRAPDPDRRRAAARTASDRGPGSSPDRNVPAACQPAGLYGG
jgi:hypothetical protein